MISLRQRLGERTTDLLEWIDYRREAGFWRFFLLPPLLSVMWAYGGWIAVGIVLAFALAITLFVALVTAAAIVGWIGYHAVSDVFASVSIAKGRTAYTPPRRPLTLR